MLRTATQRKKLCKNCPVARVADLFGDTCSLLIIRDLLKEPLRFGALEHSLAGISTRTLSSKLKALEKGGFIEHKEPAYTLTKKGRALRGVIDAMHRYGDRYL